MWARVGAKRRWLFSYISYMAHMSQEEWQVKPRVASFCFRLVDWQELGFRWMWAIILFHVGQHSGDLGLPVDKRVAVDLWVWQETSKYGKNQRLGIREPSDSGTDTTLAQGSDGEGDQAGGRAGRN